MFFRPTPYPGGNLVKTKMIHEPNSFADILKKIACNFIQPFSHSNYVLKVYRGGFVQPPPKTDQRGWPRGGFIEPPPSISVVYQPIWMKFLHNVMYDISFPKNIGLALYDLYDVSYDVIMTFWKTDFREFSSYLFLISETKFFGTKFLHQFVA